MKTFREFLTEAKITSKILIDSKTGSFHAGIQNISNIDGKEYSWNYIFFNDDKKPITTLKNGDETHIVYTDLSKKKKVTKLLDL